MIYSNESKRALGKRLAKARANAKLSQEKASRLSHVSVSAISNYENGKVKAYTMSVRRLALIYGVSVDWLLGMSETMET